MTRVTFKKLSERSARRTSNINVNGISIGRVAPVSMFAGRGWYFYANYLGRYLNTSDAPSATEDDAKAQAKKWVLNVAKLEARKP